MRSPAIHDPHASSTPLQKQATMAYNMRHAKIEEAAWRVTPKQTFSFSIPNTPFGVPKIQPPIIVPLASSPYQVMWFFDLVGETENYNPESCKSRVERAPRIEEIQAACARHYGVTRTYLISERRTADIVRPRQVAMYFARLLTTRSLSEIGRRFGNRDHTTAGFSVNKIDRLLGSDELLAADIAAIKADLAERFA